MTPAPDLRRLRFSAPEGSVIELGAERLELAVDSWIVSVVSYDSESAASIWNASLRDSTWQNAEVDRQEIRNQDGVIVHRVLFESEGQNQAIQALYLLSFEGESLFAQAVSRSPADPFDFRPAEELILSFRLEPEPDRTREVQPAWQEYQTRREPGTPAARFVLSMDPAPVLVGNVDRTFDPIFSESDFARGGRKIAPDLFEFYPLDDPVSIRLDVWTEEHEPPEGPFEEVFQAPLVVAGDQLSVMSFDQRYALPISPGTYQARVILINREVYSEEILTDREFFQRQDLERYEIRLNRQSG